MASSYTALGVELMVTGENAGTWGTKTNTNLQLFEQIAGGYLVQTLNATGTGVTTTALDVDDGALTGTACNRVIILGAESPQTIAGNKTVTIPNEPNALGANELKKICLKNKYKTESSADIFQAIKKCSNFEKKTIVVLGSNYLIGHVLSKN